MSDIICGTTYRTLINDRPIKQERSVSFEPDEIKIVIYGNVSIYQEWNKRRNEKVNFKMTNTNIDTEMIIMFVRLVVRLEDVVEILVILWNPEKYEERKRFASEMKGI